MKIVFFEDFFHPNAGYNINILSKYFSLKGHDLVIYTSEVDKAPSRLSSFFDISNIEAKDSIFSNRFKVNIKRIKTYFFYSGRAIVTTNIIKMIKSESPDILFVSGNDTYIGMLLTLKYKSLAIPLVFYSSMVEMASENRFSRFFRLFYKTFVSPIIVRNNIVTVRTQDDPYVMKFLGIPLKLAPFISLGVDTEIFRPVINRSLLREKYNISYDSFVVIYAGKLDTSKGLHILIDGFMSQLKTTSKVILLIVGDIGQEYEKAFFEFIDKSPNQILRFPTQPYEILPEFYAISDLAIFPRQISLSFFNAQACGLPVVAESNDINEERLSHGNGFTFRYGDATDMMSKIEHVANLSFENYSNLSIRASNYVNENYNYFKISDEYLKLFKHENEKQVNQFLKESNKKL
jgi:glycosyltransferase involved in cell wall biosynthesis